MLARSSSPSSLCGGGCGHVTSSVATRWWPPTYGSPADTIMPIATSTMMPKTDSVQQQMAPAQHQPEPRDKGSEMTTPPRTRQPQRHTGTLRINGSQNTFKSAEQLPLYTRLPFVSPSCNCHSRRAAGIPRHLLATRQQQAHLKICTRG